MSETFITIAERLSQLLTDRGRVSLLGWQVQKDAAARRLELTPASGWEGKNQEQRDIARDKAFAADETMAQLVEAEIRAHAELELIEADIAALDAKRRGLEWMVRDRLVDALRLQGIPTPKDMPVEVTAFDAVVQNQWDTEALDAANAWLGPMDPQPEVLEPEGPVIEDDLPF